MYQYSPIDVLTETLRSEMERFSPPELTSEDYSPKKLQAETDPEKRDALRKELYAPRMERLRILLLVSGALS